MDLFQDILILQCLGISCKCREVERLAKEEHVAAVYISTGHVGLYEKYGCEYMTQMNDMGGEPSRVYVKRFK